ncbi:DNA-binding MarR family transcriptional regulator [Chitinophaga terrae (ex Kim and Jung 2007)]|uniref:MarR family winged helix-turn-helix transcriptional regulator n=1 Tax=Chitinophaga terrae (ex Kim and Jung 2007) TaxID=408074 RepID=UPI00278327EC|nr:MarR family transcriptional regulator [Chitinophaga terrae (ex Kim and Jung 2007)]MDQ0106293.1 DNA-binding MarR family transcriptional regulator [Chitinophaga terrae (ex Kim and Jung 2007)]
MDQSKQQFFEIFTDLQCYILANMNKGNYNGVTATHYNIVEFIYRKGMVTGSELARAFGVSQPAISRQVRFLVESGLLVQRQNPGDKRVFFLEVTEKGKFLVDNSENFRHHVTARAAEILSKAELQQLSALLGKVLAEVKSTEP